MRRTFIAFLSVGVGLATAAPTLAQFQTRVSVSSASPSQVTVLRGEPAIRMTLTGVGLDRLNTARVLLFGGREVPNVHASLVPTRSSTSRVLEIFADPIGGEGRGYEIVLGSTLLPQLALSVPAQVSVRVPKPDLVVAAIQLSSVSSTQTRATIRVTNMGDGRAETAGGTGIGLACELVPAPTTSTSSNLLSSTSSLPTTGITLPPPPPLDVQLAEPLGSTESRYQAWTFDAGYGASKTSWSLVCEVDKLGAVAESNETNNRREQPISG